MPQAANADGASDGPALVPRGRTRRKRPPRPKLRDPLVVERFFSLVHKDGPLIPNAPWLGPCWLWQGPVDRYGYGIFTYKNGRWRAARYSYILEYGQPVFPTIDHLCHSYVVCVARPPCRHRLCVAPLHLEAVSSQENARRVLPINHYNRLNAKPRVYPVCINGHKWHPSLAMYDSRGKRVCGDCVEGLY